MNEFDINFNIASPADKKTKIEIGIKNKLKEYLLYKFIVGNNGTWNTLRDFSNEDKVIWIPEEEGKYTIMVQAKEENAQKPFDYVSKIEYIIGEGNDGIIESVYLDNNKLRVGEKLTVNVVTNKIDIMYRYFVREKENWQLIKDYCAENSIMFTVKKPGTHEILVECKKLDSKEKVDDFQKVKFEVIPIKDVEITNFESLNSDFLSGNELVFQVTANYEDKRMILLKFIRIDSEGNAKCVQDYSTKRMISYVEKESGNFKLLCMVKDMYSPKEYDDRAFISYTVKPYETIKIKNFTTDLSSPQVCAKTILLKAIITGGKECQYRYIIDGNYSEDSGYVRNNTYLWNTKMPGKYKLELWVRDKSFEGSYEDKTSIEFTIDEVNREPVKIKEVIVDKNTKVLKGQTVNVKAIADGGMDLRYSFIVKNDEKVLESVEYGTCNWVNFTPETGGNYELDVRVKDKYSEKEFDCHSTVYIQAFDYIPASIDYVLMPSKEFYTVGDSITLNIITQNTKETMVKFVTKINSHTVEETEYELDKKFTIAPICSGKYEIEIFAKNKDSNKEFDSKKLVKINVHDSLPITNTKVKCDKLEIVHNDSVTFTTECFGGKEIVFEFYLMEKEEWNLVQKYSRKNFFVFMPFIKGHYRILSLAKSQYKKCSYEDYDIFEFDVI